MAGVFAIIDYTHLLNPSSFTSYGSALHSIEMLYMVPRILMGLLAVVDTLLIYKISERRYNRNVALIASVLFAVMPLSWLIRRVLLDSILMPFLLSSILLALYTNAKMGGFSKNHKTKGSKNIVLNLLSGVSLGLAIFTKMPALTMIPLVGSLIYTNNNNNLKKLGLWFIPVILIPLIWPAYSISANNFGEWLNGVFWQASRKTRHRNNVNRFYLSDGSSFSNSRSRRSYFCSNNKKRFLPSALAYSISHLHISYRMGRILSLDASITSILYCWPLLIEDVSHRIARRKKKVQQILLSYCIASAIGIFGLISTIMLITNNFSLSQFEAAGIGCSDCTKYRSNHASSGSSVSNNHNNEITVISGPIYSWIFKYVFNTAHVFSHPRDSSQPITKRVSLMVDSTYRYVMSNALTKREIEDEKQIRTLGNIYNSSETIASFADNGVQYKYLMYPYINIKDCPLSNIEVRTNY